ncbi:hypothetical protein FB451DRAFT_1406078 [Mycena latifolia]|nr:hypothetical protein FB451DRAFT_1406078 [Mycena latifolia]
MYAASLAVHSDQQTAVSAPTRSVSADTGTVSADTQPVNQNGPQCAHCGWRGGSHDPSCPFSASTPRISLIPSVNTVNI